MPTHNALAFLAARLAKAQAINAADLRAARTMEERRIAEAERQLLNEVSGWVIAAFADDPSHRARER